MKIQLDTTNKTIRVENDINIGEFHKAIMGLLPGSKWKEFTLQTNSAMLWNDPFVVYPSVPVFSLPPYPWIVCGGENIIDHGSTGIIGTSDTVTYDSENMPEYTLTNGIYNIEVK